ncbi:hypothetical protein ACFQ0B_45455 [Nonomuraea thailandensis]
MRHLRAATVLPATALAISLLGGGAMTTGTASAAVPVAGVSGEARVTKELRALESAFKGRIGAYALDTATGKTLTYRAGSASPCCPRSRRPCARPSCTRRAPGSPG